MPLKLPRTCGGSRYSEISIGAIYTLCILVQFLKKIMEDLWFRHCEFRCQIYTCVCRELSLTRWPKSLQASYTTWLIHQEIYVFNCIKCISLLNGVWQSVFTKVCDKIEKYNVYDIRTAISLTVTDAEHKYTPQRDTLTSVWNTHAPDRTGQ
jgi:hypothetical protein